MNRIGEEENLLPQDAGVEHIEFCSNLPPLATPIGSSLAVRILRYFIWLDEYVYSFVVNEAANRFEVSGELVNLEEKIVCQTLTTRNALVTGGFWGGRYRGILGRIYRRKWLLKTSEKDLPADFKIPRNPNTPNPNLSSTAPAVFCHPRRPGWRQKPSPSPPLQLEVVVLTSIATSEVGFVASHFVSRLKSSRSQEHHRSVSSSVVSSPSPWSPPLPAQQAMEQGTSQQDHS
ncbi:hypothetical protein PIB30_029605 [Stylosanthes scabra]|uniref:Uncharacterized protein n=1 Tax=Stylosanthes scabra TaxID=79078 RepID=A0ABU6ZB34_9FABA|nr:hypothetical protein [Stylosanthes scabra]